MELDKIANTHDMVNSDRTPLYGRFMGFYVNGFSLSYKGLTLYIERKRSKNQ